MAVNRVHSSRACRCQGSSPAVGEGAVQAGPERRLAATIHLPALCIHVALPAPLHKGPAVRGLSLPASPGKGLCPA